MTPPARREGTPDRKRAGATPQGARSQSTPRPQRSSGIYGNDKDKAPRPVRGEARTKQMAADIYVSKAKPARRQHVTEDRSQVTPGEPVRLQKVLAQAGVASRRMAEKLIDAGRVEVNGKIVLAQGTRIDPNKDVVRVDGTRIRVDERLEYFVLNKPFGVQSTMHDDMGRPCIGDIVGEKLDAGQRLFHVGRLDANTEGLILLTNDGELANRLMHPKYEVSKTYLATVVGEMDNKDIRKLRSGVELDDGPAKADFAQIIDVWQGKTIVRVELHEGRKHIVRRLLKGIGFPVERLVRTKIHTVQLGEQTPGAIRALNSAELTSLYKAVGM
ncbi:pseudouridine synthase family protein [Corynebacterium epidermidicanis]|uniref:Pseudouridine synthase n=2 Tax=Corynebacterium epidermidicanis TaxID=1050174 RepID=A0A0G3GU19_9CORY|nr:pseudouridine synthase [Corynebacterium epidermidicanis]AKK03063.1 pseudouridine synthase family protein [Corynebacterium epidermidicanis]